MKKYVNLLMVSVLIGAILMTGIPALAASNEDSDHRASLVEYSLCVDGRPISVWAYGIDSGIYFKLRDLAAALNGTTKQFEISWDSESKQINLLEGSSYTPVGGELCNPKDSSIPAQPTDCRLFINGVRCSIFSYLINETNYVKLSDLAASLKFASECDQQARTAHIITAPGLAASTSTSDAIDNTALMNGNNSYSLDSDGNVILSYHMGVETIQAPLKLKAEDSDDSGMGMSETAFYLSCGKTAIAYGGGNGPIQVLTTEDMGKTWNTYTVDSARNMEYNKYIGFTTKNNGYLVASSGSALGTSYNYVFITSDGGKTWTQIGNPNALYPRNATGVGFSTPNIGFISYRVDSDPGPTIYQTLDGGYTWAKLNVTVPEGYDYNIPLTPEFYGGNGVYPIESYAFSSDGTAKITTYYLTSSDYGKTWTYDEGFNLAQKYAAAVKARDGRSQYDLMSSALQAKSYDDFVATNWIGMGSSPWVDSFSVNATASGAVITYYLEASTGTEGTATGYLTFVRENGTLKISAIS
jgi:photosystem II stability/assembly factor-like uncharacterized protein